VEGTIRATERVELRSTAVVTGDVFAKRFAMEQDAILQGRVDPSGEATGNSAPEANGTAKDAGKARTKSQEGGPGLFGAANRGSGQMPSGLAAAARTLSSTERPAGLAALATDPAETEEKAASKPNV
jgi:hypothetical protein